MEDNVIMTDMDESIGFYKDLRAMFESVMKDALEKHDTETIAEQVEYMRDLDEYEDYEGLLILSMNNGMGFTCQKLVDSEVIKKW